MELGQIIKQHHAAILHEWHECALADYPDEAARFLRSTSDSFANPVGARLADDLGAVLEAVGNGGELGGAADALERLVRVRAVQSLGAERALAFLPELRRIVRRTVGGAGIGDVSEPLDRAVDTVTLRAFAVYVACREQIQEIRVQEMHNRSVRVLERLERWRSRREAQAGPDDGPAGT